MNISEETLTEIKPQMRNILYPHLANTLRRPAGDGAAHLTALHIDLKRNNPEKAQNYVCHMMTKILAYMPDNTEEAVMLVLQTMTASAQFRQFIGEVTSEIIEELLPELKVESSI